MKQNALILCDSEADYAEEMADYLSKDKVFPCRIVVCTRKEELDHFLETYSVQLLVLAESFVGMSLPVWSRSRMVILNESGRVHWSDVKNIDKYQKAELIKSELIRYFLRQQMPETTIINANKRASCIGFYSPIRRCLQTTTAIAYGQLLAEQERVLYLNFEYYAALPTEEEEDERPDMMALLFYGDCSGEEFELQIRSMRKSLGNWDYILPMRNGENLTSLEVVDWMRVIEKCRALPEYDVIVLDISDSMQGVFEILNMCERVFTLTKADSKAQMKMLHYESLLEQKGYKSIVEKTRKLMLPVFGCLPETLEEYNRGELADYVRKYLLSEEEYGIYRVETEIAE